MLEDSTHMTTELSKTIGNTSTQVEPLLKLLGTIGDYSRGISKMLYSVHTNFAWVAGWLTKDVAEFLRSLISS